MDTPDPFNALATSAITANTMYKAYVEAGFTPEQALEIVKDMNRTAMLFILSGGKPPR